MTGKGKLIESQESAEAVTDRPEKIGIRHRPVQYEGIPAASAIGMALLESTGIRKLIDERCRFDPDRRILSPGMVVKALIGPTFNIRNKYPLYLVNKAYASAPTDRLFGPSVERGDLYDNALGRGLDALFGTDLDDLFTECSDLVRSRFGFESDILHMDGTDISFYGMEPPDPGDGSAVPRHNGNPKDLRRELLQYELQVMTDSNRIIRYMKPYSGGTTDPVRNRESLEFIGTHFDAEERSRLTIVADCKLVCAENIRIMRCLDLGFVSKCPETMVDDAHARAVARACGERSIRAKDVLIQDFDMDVNLAGKNAKKSESEEVRLRFVSFRRPAEVRSRIESMRSDSETSSRARYSHLERREYRTEREAIEAFQNVREDPDDPYRASYRLVRRTEPVVEKRPGPKKKGWNPPARYRGWWELEIDVAFSEEKARAIAERESTIVLVTNLPRYCSDRESYRDGATGEEVLRLYNQEYKVEHSFRLMKSGIGMNSIYLHTPSRENAMMFVICIAVLISNIVDAVFRRAGARLDGRQLTMHHLAHELQTTLVTFSRADNALELMGPGETADRFFDWTDMLRINPQLLLGYEGD